jgi:hypothetical protein
MSRTFLSYSRSDIEFVRRLQKALAEEKEETWVDWSGIPPTAEFAREIEKGIEASDNFVFVISPESVAETSYGLKEIAHAAQMGKRMVPILRRAVPNGAVPEALAKFNYIYFRETDDFETAFALLTTALHSDLAWTSAQARLLVRALEWERQEKDDSFLLRGNRSERCGGLAGTGCHEVREAHAIAVGIHCQKPNGSKWKRSCRAEEGLHSVQTGCT